MKTHIKQDYLSFSFTSPLYQEDPMAYLAIIRSQESIHWSDESNFWVVTGYEDCKALLKNPNLGRGDSWRIASTEDEPLQPVDEFRANVILLRDPPEHRRLRHLVHKAFTPKIVENLRPAIHDIIDHLLAEYENQHEMNLVEAISYPLPIMVISEMLGVPKEDWHIIRQYASGLAGVFEQLRTQQDIDDGNKLVVQMKQYFRQLIEKKKQQPADDLLTGLIAVYEEQEQVFTMDELLSNLILLVWAGHETTSNLISNAIFELLTHPAQYAQLKENRDLIPSTVTEMLRYRSSINFSFRTVLQNFDYNGQTFKQGQLVALALAAANRDPDVYTTPDTLDITRNGETPIAFGNGIHYCLGAPLAKLETEIALERLIDFMPDMQLKNPEPQWKPTVVFQGHRELYLQF